MARPLRVQYPGAVYHLTSRGNARQSIFRDDVDRETFLTIFSGVVRRYEWLCHAYCLMGNHYHLLVETPKPNLAIGMQQVNGRYTRKFNRRYGRVGYLFQSRYTAILVQKESHLLELCRYVVLNPVRAGLCRRAAEWKWSSYRALAGLERAPELLTADWILAQFAREGSAARASYRAFVAAGGESRPWERLQAGIYLGDEEFIHGVRHRCLTPR